MGQAKKQWMEEEARGYKKPPNNRVCSNHFTDYHINEFIKFNIFYGYNR
jgi:hypothetical protein